MTSQVPSRSVTHIQIWGPQTIKQFTDLRKVEPSWLHHNNTALQPDSVIQQSTKAAVRAYLFEILSAEVRERDI